MYYEPIFTIFGRGVYLYGVFIGVGLLACIAVLYYYTNKKNMPSYVQDFVFISAIVAVALGFLAAKLWQAFYDWLATGRFNFYRAGITVMGGLIGGALAFVLTYFVGGHFLFRGKRKGVHIREFNKIVLVAPICISIAHAFGRLGCLMAGCCHGKFLGDKPVFGGTKMMGTIKVGGTSIKHLGYYVPTQLYEALFLFALFAVLSILYFKGSNLLMHIYLFAYGVWRIFIEIFRADYRGGVANASLSPSQWMSIAFIAGAIILFVVYKLLKLPMKVDYGKNQKSRVVKK